MKAGKWLKVGKAKCLKTKRAKWGSMRLRSNEPATIYPMITVIPDGLTGSVIRGAVVGAHMPLGSRSEGLAISADPAARRISPDFNYPNSHGRVPWRQMALAIAILIGLGLLTISRNATYSNPVKLWQDVVDKNPRGTRGHLNLGMVLMDTEPIRAAGELNLALRDPRYRNGAAINLSAIYLNQRRYDEAEAIIHEVGINSSTLAGNLAVAQMRQGDTQRARETVDAALQKWPDAPELLANHAELERLKGRCAETLALRDPDFRGHPCQ